MSHLWPDLLRITLCPDQVMLEQGKLIISLKGMEPRYHEAENFPVEPRHEPSLWASPISMLDTALEGLPKRPHDATVVLSNHFVHYPLVQVGAPDTATPENNHVIEPLLQTALENVLARHRCRLASLKPRIIAQSTVVREELQGEPGWLVMVEDGLACLGLIQDSEFVRLRNLYLWPASSVELLTLLDHEALAAGCAELPRNLTLWLRHESDEVTLSPRSDWHITGLGENRLAGSIPRLAASQPLSQSNARA